MPEGCAAFPRKSSPAGPGFRRAAVRTFAATIGSGDPAPANVLGTRFTVRLAPTTPDQREERSDGSGLRPQSDPGPFPTTDAVK